MRNHSLDALGVEYQPLRFQLGHGSENLRPRRFKVVGLVDADDWVLSLCHRPVECSVDGYISEAVASDYKAVGRKKASLEASIRPLERVCPDRSHFLVRKDHSRLH